MELRARLRAAGLVLGVAGLLVLVALASRAGRTGAGAHGGVTLPPWAFDYVATAGLVAAGAVLLLLLSRVRLVRKPEAGNVRMLKGLALLVAIVTVLALLGHHMSLALQHFRPPAAEPSGQQGQQRLPGGSEARKTRPVEFKWEAVAITGGILLAAGGVYLVLRRRRRPAEPLPPPALPEELSAALGLALDDLRAEADARRAVIAAYARAERVLAEHGLPRRAAEAPLEYLARVLLDLRVRPAAVLDLTDLFERAKFSRQEIDASMKEDAITALAAVRDDLEEAA